VSTIPSYRTCAIGGEQSPVDLKGAIKAEIHAPVLSWKPQAYKVVNNGHTIQANAAPGSFAASENRKFELKQFHFHTPSEHAIQGRHAQMEAHFVHAEDGGELLVLGVLMEPSSKKVRNKAFAALMAAAPETEGDAELKAPLDAVSLLPKKRQFATRARSRRPPARKW
jgi:carbonic anhydrase